MKYILRTKPFIIEVESHQKTSFEVKDAYNDFIDTRNRLCATQLARREK